MKKFLILLTLFCSCKKNELNNSSNRNITVKYVFSVNHLTTGRFVMCWQNTSDTVATVNTYTFTAAQNILYVSCPKTISCWCMIQNDVGNSNDSCSASMYIDGVLKASGKNGNYQGALQLQYIYNW